MATLLLLVLATVGVGAASANALPGDVLYPVKRVVEAASLSLTLDPSARDAYRDALRARRRLEAQQAAVQGRQASVTFEGVVEAVQSRQLEISGLTVLVPNGTAAIALGDFVAVTAHLRDRTIIADTLTVLRPAPIQPSATPTRARPTLTPQPTRVSPTPAATRQRPTPTLTAEPTHQRPTATDRPVPTTTRPAPAATRPEATRPEGGTPPPTTLPERPESASPEPAATSDRPADPSPTDSPDSAPTTTPTGRPR